MVMKVKVAGSWRSHLVATKVAGSWRPVNKVYVKKAGVWKTVYTRGLLDYLIDGLGNILGGILGR
jgi:hypothetical protein